MQECTGPWAVAVPRPITLRISQSTCSSSEARSHCAAPCLDLFWICPSSHRLRASWGGTAGGSADGGVSRRGGGAVCHRKGAKAPQNSSPPSARCSRGVGLAIGKLTNLFAIRTVIATTERDQARDKTMSTRPSDDVGEGRGGGKLGNAAPPHPLPHHPHARPQPGLPPSPPPSRSRESGSPGGEGGWGQGRRGEMPSHPVPHEDPHKLQLQEGDLRHRVEARGSRPASSDLTGPGAAASPAAAATTTPDDPRHHQQQETQQPAGALVAQPAAASQPQPQPQQQQQQQAPVKVQDLPSGALSSAPEELPYPTFFDPFVPAEPEVISAPSSSSAGTPAPRIVDHDRIRSLASGEPSPASSGTATPSDIPPNATTAAVSTATTSTTTTSTTTADHHATDHAGRRPLKSLRPLVHAVMAFEKSRKFSTGTSVHRKRQMSTLIEKEGHFGPALTVCFYPCLHLVFITPLYSMSPARDRTSCIFVGGKFCIFSALVLSLFWAVPETPQKGALLFLIRSNVSLCVCNSGPFLTLRLIIRIKC